MKRTLSALLIGTLVLASLTACGKEAGSRESQMPKSSPEKPTAQTSATVPTATNESSSESVSGASIAEQFMSEPIVDRQIIDQTNKNVIAVMNSYKAIFKNESTFFDTYSNEDKYINQLPSTTSGDEVTMEIKKFSIIDLDYNGLPEIVFCISIVDGIDVYYSILSYQENQIRSYSLPDRAFSELKIDGTFSFSSGAADHGFGNIKFTKAATETVELIDKNTYCESHNNDGISYIVNGKPATADIFSKALDYQDSKPDVTWYDYSENNINEHFPQQN